MTDERSPAERNWTDDENDRIVADYFAMFRRHLSGESRFKTEHREALIESGLQRSGASVEFKHRNISAVLANLNCPWLPGYRPAFQYQRSLLDAVLRARGSDMFRNTVEVVLSSPNVLSADNWRLHDVFVPKPSASVVPKELREHIERILRKIDPAERDQRNRDLGAVGEEFVLKVEKAKLVALGKGDLAGDVRRISLVDDGAGYDILSFDEEGRERFIEVKTTAGVAEIPFYITPNELKVSHAKPGWMLYRVHQAHNEQRIFTVEPPIEAAFRMSTALWKASLNGDVPQ